MVLNYVLSFCKITSASKIFTRSFYLPLLKPVTPKDAVRTFRITGKWILGAKIQHYIPVLLNHTKKRPRNSSDYGKLAHQNSDDFKYVIPTLDPESENYKLLSKMLQTENGESMYVYTIEDKKYQLVISAPLELAIRAGDVVDILISQRNDKIIIKLRDSKKIPLEITSYTGTNNLYKGEGATTEEEEKNHHHGRFTMSIAKVFEEKERLSEEWERELQRIIQKRRKQAYENSIEYDEMVRENVNKLDWRNFEKEAKKVIEQVADPIPERHFQMEVEDFELTRYANETLTAGNGLEQLPTMKEISEVVKNLASAVPHKIDAECRTNEPRMSRRVSGVKVTLASGKECFITGQMVHTEEGEVFVPGQTVQNEFGNEYVPGITVIMDNKPTLISGLIMAEEEREPMFLPTDASVTEEGQLTFATEMEERPKPPPVKREKHTFKNSFARIGEEEVVEVMEEVPQVVEVVVVEEQPKKPRKKRRKKVEKEKTVEVVEEVVQEVKAEEAKVEVKVEEVVKEEEVDLEKQRKEELERLRLLLLDDGMDEMLSNLERKKLNLKQKLDELRKIQINLSDDSVNYVNINDALEITENLTDSKETANKLAEILLTLTRRVASFRDKNSINTENIDSPCVNYSSGFITDADEKLEQSSDKLQGILKASVVAANDIFKTRPKDQLLALQAIGETISDSLHYNHRLIMELCQLMNTCLERNEMCTSIFKQLTQSVAENKVHTLKEAVRNGDGVIEAIAALLNDESELLSAAFTRIAKNNNGIAKTVIKDVTLTIDDIATEKTATDMLRTVITTSLNKHSCQFLDSITEKHSRDELNEFLTDASAFAKILSAQHICETLTAMTSNCKPDLTPLATDTQLLEFFKRLTTIRLLTDKDSYLRAALERIRKNWECGKTDPRIRQLIRESATLISTPLGLKSSREIPLRLMKSQNSLAIEDFLTQRTRIEYPVLVSRQGLQAIVPGDATRAVLAGRVPYTVLDEAGEVAVKPVNELGAFRVGRGAGRRAKSLPHVSSGVSDSELQGQVRKLCKKLLNDRRRVA